MVLVESQNLFIYSCLKNRSQFVNIAGEGLDKKASITSSVSLGTMLGRFLHFT